MFELELEKAAPPLTLHCENLTIFFSFFRLIFYTPIHENPKVTTDLEIFFSHIYGLIGLKILFEYKLVSVANSYAKVTKPNITTI